MDKRNNQNFLSRINQIEESLKAPASPTRANLLLKNFSCLMVFPSIISEFQVFLQEAKSAEIEDSGLLK